MKYNIGKEFKFFRKFSPPFNTTVFRLALFMPKFTHSTKTVSSVKRKAVNKDGDSVSLYLFSPKSATGKLPAAVFLALTIAMPVLNPSNG